ncbi:MAG: glycosyltransferase [Nitrospinae bacterium]|nr:glycosyltransferase [Nitrospinota bacterium]
MKEGIAAIVVTYNRKQLLGECLGALLNQTYPLEAVYIIDNASTDGAPEFLLEKGLIDRVLYPDKEPLEAVKEVPLPQFSDKTVEIHYVRMTENTGGAGGQHEGIKRGCDAGFDWLWLMDDDGLPAENCLSELLKVSRDYNIDVVSPVVYHQNLEEPFILIETQGHALNRDYSSKEITEEYESVFPYGITAFLGLLVPRYVVHDIGNVKREMFIWGDEYDFVYRIASKYKCGTVTTAAFRHPPHSKPIPLIMGRLKVYEVSDIRLFHYIRNRIFLKKTYFSYKRAILVTVEEIIKYAIYLLRKREWHKFRLVILAIWQAFTNNWQPFNPKNAFEKTTEHTEEYIENKK